MNPKDAEERIGGKPMEILIPVGILIVWIVLQTWVLPRLGVNT